MKFPLNGCLTAALLLTAWSHTLVAGAEPAAAAEPVDIGSRLEPFVDRTLIDTMRGASLKLHSPVPREVVWEPEVPWESTSAAYFTVLRDEDGFKMVYRASPRDEPDAVCLMTSEDGITWQRPELNLFEFRGSKQNNIIWRGGPWRTTTNFAPFRDTRPGVPPEEQYKALAGSPLHAFGSPDGIHWKLLVEKPVLTGHNFDSQNVAFWDPRRECYMAFVRHRVGGGIRWVASSTSTDFRTWSTPEPIRTAGVPPEHLYTNATAPYFRAPHIYFSFMKRFQPDRMKFNEGVSDAVFLTSRDGIHFDRTFREALIRPGRDRRNWSARSNMPAWGLVQTADDEMSLYVLEMYRTHGIRVRRATFRLDGVASIHAGRPAGEIVTRPLTFTGAELVLNTATSGAGSVRVELQDTDGKPLPGYTAADCDEFYGDEIAVAVTWKGKSDVAALSGQAVRLRFVLDDADVYSFRFRAAAKPDDDQAK